MLKKNAKLVLIPSNKVQTEVRIPRTTRKLLGLQVGDRFFTREVCQAYKTDLLKYRNIKKTLSPDERKLVVFVSNELFRKIEAEPGNFAKVDLETLARYLTLKTKLFKTRLSEIIIGADPEVALINERNNLVCAGDFKRFNSLISEFGKDASGVQAELRPYPAKTSQGLIENTKRILEDNLEYLEQNNLTLKASSVIGGFFFGNHIHLDIPKLAKENLDNCFDYLDRVLITLISPLFATIEGKTGKYRRLYYGDIYPRWKSSKDKEILEWRVPGSETFAHPTVFSWLVSSVLLVINHILARSDKIETTEDLIQSVNLKKLDLIKVKDVTNEKVLDKTIDIIKSLDNFDKYNLGELLEVSKQNVEVNQNVLGGWIKGEAPFL